MDFLRLACNSRRKALGQAELDPLEFYAYIIPKVREIYSPFTARTLMVVQLYITGFLVPMQLC